MPDHYEFLDGLRYRYLLISISLEPNLSLISQLKAEIYYRTGITGNTDIQTDRHTHKD